MFEIVAGAQPGQLKADTRRATIDGAIKIIGRELRHMPKVLPEMNAVQRCLLKLSLYEAIGAIAAHENSLEPARGSGMPGTIREGEAIRS